MERMLATPFHKVGPHNKVIKEAAEKKVNSLRQRVGRRHTFFKGHDAREYCAVPEKWPRFINELNTFLTTSQVMGLFPEQQNITSLPTDQPTTCPAITGSWWPGDSENLRSTCPWTYTYTDIGESFYPRYLRQAVCLCSSCINANVMGCKNLRQDVTVFQRVACKDGLAVMKAVKKNIVVGCYCAKNPTHSSGGNGPTPPNDVE
ncbi:hypothetical protein Btru_051718 [Bulinus truncatus]|nr:hypothetical protein Btru_051718 [Bulinus truncatus]